MAKKMMSANDPKQSFAGRLYSRRIKRSSDPETIVIFALRGLFPPMARGAIIA